MRQAQVVGPAGQSLADVEVTKASIADAITAGVASDGERFAVAGSFATLWTTSLPVGSSPWLLENQPPGRGIWKPRGSAVRHARQIEVGGRVTPNQRRPPSSHSGALFQP